MADMADIHGGMLSDQRIFHGLGCDLSSYRYSGEELAPSHPKEIRKQGKLFILGDIAASRAPNVINERSREEEMSEHFEWTGESPYMLFFNNG